MKVSTPETFLDQPLDDDSSFRKDGPTNVSPGPPPGPAPALPSPPPEPPPLLAPAPFINKLSPTVPPGSLFDQTLRPASPCNVMDFDFNEDYAVNYVYAPSGTILDIDLEPDDEDDELWQDTNDIDTDSRVVHIVEHPRLVGIHDDRTVTDYSCQRPIVYRLSVETGELMDTGANCCITNNLSCLVDVEDIPPFSVGVAVSGDNVRQSLCTKRGFLPLPLPNGDHYFQRVYYNEQASDTILSPQAICEDSNGRLTKWTQTGTTRFADEKIDGKITFYGPDDTVVLSIPLDRRNGLYFSKIDTMTIDSTAPSSKPVPVSAQAHKVRRPTTQRQQLEAELWAARLGYCGEWQLDAITKAADGVPDVLAPHPFRFSDVKEQANVRRQPASSSAPRLNHKGQRFFMDFGFLRASTADFARPDAKKDRVISSFDGYTSYLAVVDDYSRYTWVFLCKTKEPPVELVLEFLHQFGLSKGGLIRCDEGGELALSDKFRDAALQHHYIVEPTGPDTAQQNAGVERFNDTLAVITRALLYGSGLTAEYWSAAIVHAAYIINHRVHQTTKVTPFERWFGKRPNLKRLRTFGSRVCVKRAGKRRSKLDRHDFSGIFVGYTATDRNIRYIDCNTGAVKIARHAVFDEAWYLHPKRPPAAEMLYNLGFVDRSEIAVPHPEATTYAAYPPSPPKKPWCPGRAYRLPLPLRLSDEPIYAAAAAKIKAPLFSEVDPSDRAQVYLSPHPYNNAFEERVRLGTFNLNQNDTAGLTFHDRDGKLFLKDILPSTPCARIHNWRSRLRGAWLISVNGVTVDSARSVRTALADAPRDDCRLLFAHSEIRHGLTNAGIPLVNLDQLNPRHHLQDYADIPEGYTPDTLFESPMAARVSWIAVDSGGVLNQYTRANRLTRGKLQHQDDWNDWQESEFLQLDQYMKQYMFGDPRKVESASAIFNLVWSYNIKTEDGRKKARCTCDGSTRAGQVRVLDHTYANCVDHTSSRLFYAISAVENNLVHGADVSNAFGEAPPPKQGFFIRPDRAFHEWWTKHLGRPPIPQGHVVPVLRAMQGHPESPRLWEKHIDKILRDLGLTPTVHEPCLYSGTIDNERVLFMKQVDDFAISTRLDRTAAILLDRLDDSLSMAIKRQGRLPMFNGLNVFQSQDYIKVSCETYIDKICTEHEKTWMKDSKITADRPTPLPSGDTFMKQFINTRGDPDVKLQEALAKRMGISYRQGVGELIYAMVTCRPDISFAVVKLAQFSSCPAECHYNGLRHCLKYLRATKSDGIHYWRSTPNMALEKGPVPNVSSADQDILADDRPQHHPATFHGYADSDWATCPLTRRSFTGTCMLLAGAVIAYKTRLQPTVALSSTEAEFMAACDAGKICLFVRSIMHDLGIPQDAASFLYEDNEGAIAMANAQKPTTRTRHMDIRYFAIVDWVERDLLVLDYVHTSKNLADNFTKPLGRIQFHRHVDFILGHIPPSHAPLAKQRIGYVPLATPSGTRQPNTVAPRAATVQTKHDHWKCFRFDHSDICDISSAPAPHPEYAQS